MGTASDIIKGSLRLIGVTSQGETPSSAELADGLSALNDLLDSWSNENLVVPYRVSEEFTFIASQQSYTMGSGGDFATTWPMEILKASYQDDTASPSLELPIQILSLEEWANITLKETESTIPTRLYIENTYPLKTLKFWPVPSEAKKVVLHSIQPMATFDLITDTVTLPPGYARALRYNLAVELAPEYGTEGSISVQYNAAASKAALKSKNIKPNYLSTDAAVNSGRGGFNWRTGE